MDDDLLNRKTFLKKIIFIGFPMVLQTALSNLLNFIDNIMVGGLGSVAIEAVSITNQMFFVYICVFMWHYLRRGSVQHTVLWEKRFPWRKKNIPSKMYFCNSHHIAHNSSFFIFQE
jgi:hypothetical protein